MLSSSLARFRIIALLEGVSSVALFFIAMPLKYLADIPIAVRITGTLHGFLFVVYMIAGLSVAIEHSWGIRRVILSILASVGPGTTFLLEPQLKADRDAEIAAQSA